MTRHTIAPRVFAIFVLALFVAALGATPARAQPTLPDRPEDRSPALWSFMDDYLLALYDRNPTGYYQIVNDESRLGEMTDTSLRAVEEWNERQREFLSKLDELDTSDYSPKDRVDHDLMRAVLERSLARASLHPEQTPVTSISGPQIWLPQMGSRVPMRTRAHQQMYLSRLKRVDITIGDHIDNMRTGIATGRVMPKVVAAQSVNQTLSQCTDQISDDPTRSPFYAPLRSLDPDDPIAAEARQVISTRIVPVFKEFALFLANEYLPACRDSVAASDSIDGIEGYNLLLAHHTTTDLTARQIHDIGLEQVQRLKSEMHDVIERTDWYQHTGSDIEDDDQRFASFVEYLRTDPRFYHSDPDALIEEYRAISKRIDPELVSLFGRLPRLPYGVKRMPRFQEPSSPTAYYYNGSLESGVPGYFIANASNLDQRPRHEMLALTIHEAVPGHHLQIALAQELENQHPIRRTLGFTAYSEGWALYSERLGLEMGDPNNQGLYSNPYDDFGRLNMEMWRALRLVVDTGIHAFGWSRQRAIDTMLLHSSLAPHNITAEVDRYIGWPGQATAYMIGQQRILELRARAEQQLGDDFDIRAFHDEILSDAALPLPVLENKMNNWIDSRRDD